MQVRFSIARGQPVVLDDSGEMLGNIDGILLDPDRGLVAGFFVRVPSGFFSSMTLFLSSNDIIRWGTAAFVKRASVLAEPGDFLRVQPLLEDKRSVLGQPIVTKGGVKLGTCKDVQFDTLHFRVHWLFPKTIFHWATPISVSDVLEITPKAIIVRDPLMPVVEEEEKTTAEVMMPQVPEAA